MKKDSKPVINFGSGPAALPEEVLQQASEAIIDYRQTGLSILGIPHRGKLFGEILEESKALVKELCGLGNEYEVLWMQGGGRLQFAMIPMNFLPEHGSAGYIESGYWAKDAMQHAAYYGNAITLASSADKQYTMFPDWPEYISPDLAYVHVTTNNTIYGTQLREDPACPVPLIADMSSDIFSRHREYDKYAMFYAVAQKNIGPAGATLSVIRKDLLQHISRELPPILDYSQHAKQNSVLNTPPVFAIYTSLLTLRWTKERGIKALEQENEIKAAMLYEAIEKNPLFYCVVKEQDRSRMNVVFRAHQAAHEMALIQFCEQNGITGIAGHRRTGGFRVSLYNAITIENVQQLIHVINEFSEQNDNHIND